MAAQAASWNAAGQHSERHAVMTAERCSKILGQDPGNGAVRVFAAERRVVVSTATRRDGVGGEERLSRRGKDGTEFREEGKSATYRLSE